MHACVRECVRACVSACINMTLYVWVRAFLCACILPNSCPKPVSSDINIIVTQTTHNQKIVSNLTHEVEEAYTPGFIYFVNCN